MTEIGPEIGPEVGRGARRQIGRDVGIEVAGRIDTTTGPAAPIVPLNEAATIYEALASQIRGTAVGWSDTALAQLERGLLQRYGPLIGGRSPVRRLVRLATRQEAA